MSRSSRAEEKERSARSTVRLERGVSSKPSLTVFTDGACEGNGGSGARGGMGIHFPDGQLPDIAQPFTQPGCTNQKTELLAILIALQTIDRKVGLHKLRIRLYTDSMYSINCLTKWIHGWQRNGWITSKKTPVLNREYIEPIYQYLSQHSIQLKHVPAHTGGTDRHSLANHAADRLAVQASARSKGGERQLNDCQGAQSAPLDTTATGGYSDTRAPRGEISVELVFHSDKPERKSSRPSGSHGPTSSRKK